MCFNISYVQVGKIHLYSFLALLICSGCVSTTSSTIREDTSRYQIDEHGNIVLQRVVVEGIGRDFDSARKDGFSKAIENVVGVLIESESMLQNDRMIIDEISTLSDGFVEHYDIINQSVKNETVHIFMDVIVRRGALVSRFTHDNIQLSNIAQGELLYAKAYTQNKIIDDAGVLISKLFQNNPLFYEVELSSSFKIIDLNKLTEKQIKISKTWAECEVTIQLDNSYYNEVFVPKFDRIFKNISKKKSTFELKNAGKYEKYNFDFSHLKKSNCVLIPMLIRGDDLTISNITRYAFDDYDILVLHEKDNNYFVYAYSLTDYGKILIKENIKVDNQLKHSLPIISFLLDENKVKKDLFNFKVNVNHIYSNKYLQTRIGSYSDGFYSVANGDYTFLQATLFDTPAEATVALRNIFSAEAWKYVNLNFKSVDEVKFLVQIPLPRIEYLKNTESIIIKIAGN